MASKQQLEDMIKALMPLLDQLHAFEETYADVLREYSHAPAILTEEDRADAAIHMIRKYSNL